MRKLFLPAWYLPNGTINAAESQLEDASSSCERWGIWCAALVVVGIIAELVIAYIAPPYNSFLTDSTIADAAVAIGIVGEVSFGMWNNRTQTELRKRSNDKLSDAIDRAAKLEREAAEARERTAAIERLTSWRKIPEDKRATIADGLRPIATTLNVFIEYQTGDPEAWSFANDISHVFLVAGLQQEQEQIRGTNNSFLFETIFGVHLSANPDTVNGEIIIAAFASAGIPITIREWSGLWMAPVPPNRPRPNVRIFVAPKTPPALAEWIEANRSRGNANNNAATK
jgi:hypothetical protein